MNKWFTTFNLMKFKDIYLQLEPEMDAAAEIFAAGWQPPRQRIMDPQPLNSWSWKNWRKYETYLQGIITAPEKEVELKTKIFAKSPTGIACYQPRSDAEKCWNKNDQTNKNLLYKHFLGHCYLKFTSLFLIMIEKIQESFLWFHDSG